MRHRPPGGEPPEHDVAERLRDAEELLAAIRSASVDAFVVVTGDQERVVFTDQGVERPYRAIVEGMTEGAATLAPDGTILYANEGLATMVGIAAERLVGTSFLDLADVHADSLARLALTRAETTWRGDVSLRAAAGTVVPTRVSLAPLTLANGRVVTSAVVTDLRDQRRADAVAAEGQLTARVLDQASEAIVVCDEAGRVRQVNREALQLHGPGDPIGKAFADAFALEVDPASEALEWRSRHVHRLPVRLRGPEGSLRLLLSASPLAAPDGEGLGTVVTMTDVTAMQAAAERLEGHVRRQRMSADLGRAALTGVALPELVRDCSATLGSLLGRASVQAWGEFIATPAPPARAERGTTVRREVVTSAGVVGYLEVDTGPTRCLTTDEVDLIDSLVSLLSLAAEQRHLHDLLSFQAHHDDLTGLPNRVLLEDRLRQAVARSHREGTHVAILFIDLDRFKHVNDTLGHEAGNDVLVQIGERLTRHVRETDTVARWGGDEFVVVHGDLRDANDALPLADALAKALARPFTVAGRSVTVRATVGISSYPRDGDDIATLIAKSDSAMYHGKRGGRNTVRVYSQHLHDLTLARLERERDLQAAVLDHGLELHFQPQVSTRGVLRGVEALVRWKHREHGWIPPSQFVPMIEELGLAGELGAWALEQACRRAAPWTTRPGGPARVSVNVSPSHVVRQDFVATVERALAGAGLAPEHLELEVAEGIMIHDREIVVEALTRLRAMGVTIALDDFGLGYSPVGSLRSLPLDRLKVDKSFVDTRSEPTGSHQDQLAVLIGITTMAQALRLSVTIEGVETEAELDMARLAGCDEVQGYLLGGPVPASAIEQRFSREGPPAG
jgi:diguanylate cyclase (GGDEF)-like protein/PAS domain S-box-containing protein